MIFAKVKPRREATSNNGVRDTQRLRATGATQRKEQLLPISQTGAFVLFASFVVPITSLNRCCLHPSLRRPVDIVIDQYGSFVSYSLGSIDGVTADEVHAET